MTLPKKLKQLAKPSKRRKWNRAQRKLLSVRQLWRMPDPHAEAKYTKYIKELKEQVVSPKFFNYSHIAIFLRQIRYILRKFYGNISEKQYNRLHRWFWVEKKKRKNSMPYNFFDKVENKIYNVLYRAKLFYKPLYLKSFMKNKNKSISYLCINRTWFLKTYRNPTLSKGDFLSIPLNQSMLGFLSKIECHNLVKLYFNLLWLTFPLKNQVQQVCFYSGVMTQKNLLINFKWIGGSSNKTENNFWEHLQNCDFVSSRLEFQDEKLRGRFNYLYFL